MKACVWSLARLLVRLRLFLLSLGLVVCPALQIGVRRGGYGPDAFPWRIQASCGVHDDNIVLTCMRFSRFTLTLRHPSCLSPILSVFPPRCKVFVDTRHKVVTFFLFACLMLSWGYLRLYAFPVAALFPIFKNVKNMKATADSEDWGFFVFLLLTVFVMNIYW